MDYKASLALIAQHQKLVEMHKLNLGAKAVVKSFDSSNVNHLIAHAKAVGSYGKKASYQIDMK